MIKKKFFIKKKIFTKNILGTNLVPRVSIFSSNKYLYVQLINDLCSHTLISGSNLLKTNFNKEKQNNFFINQSIAFLIGQLFGKLIINKKIGLFCQLDLKKNVYHGIINKFTEGAKKSGLIF
jgi:large subunit ribosomal protein L18